MNQPWGKNRRLQATYITGYLTLVMLSVTGLLIQGGVATLAGIIAFSSVCLILVAIVFRSKGKRARAGLTI